jgi:hypothetical protein
MESELVNSLVELILSEVSPPQIDNASDLIGLGDDFFITTDMEALVVNSY